VITVYLPPKREPYIAYLTAFTQQPHSITVFCLVLVAPIHERTM